LLVMLGMEPDRPDTGYGWITPKPDSEDVVRAVTSFVEKPDARLADELMESGALWSSFTFVTTAESLMHRFRCSMSWLVDRFSRRLTNTGTFDRQYGLLSLYDRLPTVDFSRRVLEHTDTEVHVLPVPPCGWTDLGTPQRVSECVTRNACSRSDPECLTTSRATRSATHRPASADNPQPCAVDLAEVAAREAEPGIL
jgi:mannose-1-phosphate guanylyltransferase